MSLIDDEITWNIIGGNGFCSFKYFSKNQYFCKNDLNITGFCSKQSCPLSNSKYATVIEKNGEIYLYIKDRLNLRFPDKLWKKFILSRNFMKSLQELDLILNFWPKFFVHKTKYKLTKLHQILIRRKINNIRNKYIFTGKKKKKILNKIQESKIIENIKFENLIEKELLYRFNLGMYGNLYSKKPIQIWKSNSLKIQNSITEIKKTKFVKKIAIPV